MKYRDRILLGLLLAAVGLAVVTGCGGEKSLATLSSRELFDQGKGLYDQNKYLKAVTYFQTIVYNFPGETVVDTAQYYLALSYFGAEQYELAQVEFNRLAINYPQSAYFESSLFMRAVCFFEVTPVQPGLDQTELQQAIRQFEEFIIDYPESDRVPDAQKYLSRARGRLAEKAYNAAQIYQYIRAFEAAKIYYQMVIDEHIESAFAPSATFRLAEIEYRQGHFAAAYQKLTSFLEVFPDHELVTEARTLAPKAAFEAGEQALEGGDTTQARQHFQRLVDNFPDDKRAEKAAALLSSLPQNAVTHAIE